MPNTPTYAHIGAPKAASKSLQKHLFRAHPQLAHLGMGIDGRVGWADTRRLCLTLCQAEIQSLVRGPTAI